MHLKKGRRKLNDLRGYNKNKGDGVTGFVFEIRFIKLAVSLAVGGKFNTPRKYYLVYRC